MKPIRTPLCTGVDLGPPGSDILPLPSWRETNEHGVTAVFSVWQPTELERKWLANGGNVLVGVFQDPLPPISLGIVTGPDFETFGVGVMRDAHLPDPPPLPTGVRVRVRRWWADRSRRAMAERVIPFVPAHGEKPSLPALDRRRE